jgi:hypothetical protein
MHSESIIITGTEYKRLFDSKFLATKRCKIETVKMSNITYYKVYGFDWSETTWNELEKIISR